ncbi:MAG TPA: response regulator transcription factor [Bryobacteraceae bacterium]|nr:response regulator transcription factor [Bryobacteraceae bacterium]
MITEIFVDECRAQSTELTRKTVAVCDPQPVTVAGFEVLLAKCPDLAFVASADSLIAAAEVIARHSPSVMVLDKGYGAQPVLDFISRLKEVRSGTAIVVWGTSITEAEALRFLQQGARGIIRKSAPVEKLAACLEAAAAGITWMEDAVFRETGRAESYSRSELTARESQVMALVEQGLKNKEIGRELGIRPGTVKIHLKHIFEKTGVRGRYGLALSGFRHRGVPSLMTV